MNECGIKRYILITGLNVDTTTDKQRELELLMESAIDWTLVRLPLIELTDKKSAWEASLEDCPGEKISARDLADFLIAQLSEEAYIKKAPFIANVS
jgi:hypothetical protein